MASLFVVLFSLNAGAENLLTAEEINKLASMYSKMIHDYRFLDRNEQFKNALRTLDIALSFSEIEKVWSEYNLIMLRPLTHDTLILGCGNEPKFSPNFDDFSARKDQEAHRHPDADTIDIDIGINPTIVANFDNQKLFSFFKNQQKTYGFLRNELAGISTLCLRQITNSNYSSMKKEFYAWEELLSFEGKMEVELEGGFTIEIVDDAEQKEAYLDNKRPIVMVPISHDDFEKIFGHEVFDQTLEIEPTALEHVVNKAENFFKKGYANYSSRDVQAINIVPYDLNNQQNRHVHKWIVNVNFDGKSARVSGSLIIVSVAKRYSQDDQFE
jgi:hypothetical protein